MEILPALVYALAFLIGVSAASLVKVAGERHDRKRKARTVLERELVGVYERLKAADDRADELMARVAGLELQVSQLRAENAALKVRYGDGLE